MRRAAVFAHYDKDRIIDDYVIYYLKSLSYCIIGRNASKFSPMM